MNSTSKLQLLSLIVLVSVLSIGVSVLLLLASGNWQGTHDSHVYQQYIHTSLIIGREQQILTLSPQHFQHHPLTKQGQTEHRSASYYNLKAKRAMNMGRGGNKVTISLATDLYYNNTTHSEHLQTVRLKHKRLSKKQYHRMRENHTLLLDSVGNASAEYHLVLGQQRDITASDLCPQNSHVCTEYLRAEGEAVFRACAKKSGSHLKGDLHCHCKFMNTTGHRRVALVSLPGSGNTWLRGLLERATGVCTGSLFCDKILHGGGMCGEGMRDGVLVVKTHDTRLQWTDMHYKSGKWSDTRPFFDAAIVVIRSPFKALVAEWNRQNAYKFSKDQQGSSHVKYLQSSAYFCKFQCIHAMMSMFSHIIASRERAVE